MPTGYFDVNYSRNRGNFFIITGPSGVGKNTLIKGVLENCKELTFIPSITTRPMRHGEDQGDPYYFVLESEFRGKISENELLEWQVVNGYYYGCSGNLIAEKLSQGLDIIKDLEVLGVHEATLKLPLDICSIFVLPPSREELIRRIKKRHSETLQEIETRINRMDFEMSQMGLFDYFVCNNKLDHAVEDLLAVIKVYRGQKVFQEYMETQGGSFIFRTITFIFRGDEKGTMGNSAGEEVLIELPKTKLGKYETREKAFERLIRMMCYKASLLANPGNYKIIGREERFLQHDHPCGYMELNEVCALEPVSKSAMKELVALVSAYNAG